MPIVFLSGHADVPTTARTMKHGAINFFTKPVDSKDLIEAIHESFILERKNRVTNMEVNLIKEKVNALGRRFLYIKEKELEKLKELSLKRTQVTDAGVKKLQTALPKCKIVR